MTKSYRAFKQLERVYKTRLVKKVPDREIVYFSPSFSRGKMAGWGVGTKTLHVTKDACHDRGAPLFFSEVPQFGSLRPLPKSDLEKNKTATG